MKQGDWARRQELRERVDEDTFHAFAESLGLAGPNGVRCPYPDHEDSEPSVGIWWHDGVWLWRCRGCDAAGRHTTGDVVKFVRIALGLSNDTAAVRWAEKAESDTPPRSSSPSVFPDSGAFGRMRGYVRASWGDRANACVLVAKLMNQEKGVGVDPSWVVRTFRLGASPAWEDGGGPLALVMPYLRSTDGKGKRRAIVGCARRWRTAGGHWTRPRWAAGIPKKDILYGEWRDRGQPKVILCEGESDTMAVAWWLRERKRILVMGVPGASAEPTDRIIGMLSGRAVVLLPDVDEAGQGWARAWRAALGRSGASVRVAALPAGTDACQAGRRAVMAALRRSS